MTDDFPDWQKAVMAFKGAASEMTDDYPDWVMGVAVEAGSQVGGGQLIDVKTTSQYYDAKTATLYYGGGSWPNSWWSEACRGSAGTTVVTDYLTLDLTGLTVSMTTPILRADFNYAVYNFIHANDYGNGWPAICKNDNSVIVAGVIQIERTPDYIERHYSLIGDITTEKNNKIKIRFKTLIRSNTMDSLCSVLRMWPFIQLFDAES